MKENDREDCDRSQAVDVITMRPGQVSGQLHGPGAVLNMQLPTFLAKREHKLQLRSTLARSRTEQSLSPIASDQRMPPQQRPGLSALNSRIHRFIR